jgi:hypothetical protein
MNAQRTNRFKRWLALPLAFGALANLTAARPAWAGVPDLKGYTIGINTALSHAYDTYVYDTHVKITAQDASGHFTGILWFSVEAGPPMSVTGVITEAVVSTDAFAISFTAKDETQILWYNGAFNWGDGFMAGTYSGNVLPPVFLLFDWGPRPFCARIQVALPL